MSQKIVGLKAAFGQDFIDNTNIKIELIYLKKHSPGLTASAFYCK